MSELTAERLRDELMSRYEFPEWQTEPEVTLGGRRMDVVALNLWNARSYRIVGFEIKVSRGDWLRELSDFTKQEEWLEVVDTFYVVTPPKLVKPEELPAGWGLLEFTGAKMMTRMMPVSRPPRTTLPREVASRFIGRAVSSGQARSNEEMVQLRQKLHAELTEIISRQIKGSYESQLEESRAALRDYNALLRALGVNPGGWKPIENALKAAAVYTSAKGDVGMIRAQVANAIAGFERHTEAMRAALRSLE